MRRLLLLALFAACAPTPHPPEQRVAGPIQRVAGHCPAATEVTDALGEKVQLGTNHERLTTIVVFLSRSAADDAADMIQKLDERLLNGPVQMVGIVDLHKYAHLFRGTAERQLKKSAAESRDRRRDRRKKHGVDSSPTFVDRWHVIGDFDGSLLTRFHVSPEPAQPVAFVLGTCGQISGPFHNVEETLRAVDHASSRSARRSHSPRRLRATR